MSRMGLRSGNEYSLSVLEHQFENLLPIMQQWFVATLELAFMMFSEIRKGEGRGGYGTWNVPATLEMPAKLASCWLFTSVERFPGLEFP